MCEFFKKNACDAGDKCKYRHVVDTAASAQTLEQPNEHKPKNETKIQTKAKAKSEGLRELADWSRWDYHC